MSREGVQSLAAWAMAAVASLVSIVAAEFLAGRTPEAEMIAFLVGTVGYFAVFQVTLWLGGQYRYRKILGEWYYVSRRYDDPEARSYARMVIKRAPDGGLDYDVDLYASHADLIASETAPVPTTGDAKSLACRYHENDNRIDILYELSLRSEGRSDNKRYGMIRIRTVERGVLEGQWESSTGGLLSLGEWRAARRKRFAEFLKAFEAFLKVREDEKLAVHFPGTKAAAPATADAPPPAGS